MKRETDTYAGIEEQYAAYDSAKIVLVPVPYDGTSTWGKGADKGPEAFLAASENMELYDIETDSEVYRRGIALDAPVDESSSPEAMCEAVENRVTQHLSKGKFVTLFGGEHSVSIGTLRAFRKHYGKITVIQIDAHADLRPEYDGSACNHACAVHESSKKDNLIQIGIRSMDISERVHTNYEQTYFAHEIAGKRKWMKKVLEQIEGPVFVTIDLDAFDSGIMPSTGTPEPGGLSFYEVCKLLKKVFTRHQVVGFDIVELMPNDINRAPDFLAAKLYYKLLSYKFELNDEQ